MRTRPFYYSLFILLIIFPFIAIAVPPYFGVSVKENLAFTQEDCLYVAKTVLIEDNFAKIVQYKGGSTIFAAYRNQLPYKYKVFIKCLAESGVIIISAVANVPKNARGKAESLQRKIQQYEAIAPVSKIIPQEEIYIDETNTDVSDTETDAQQESISKNPPTANNTTDTKLESWAYSLLDRLDCLKRAEKSLRNVGFYKSFDFDDDSVFGKNNDDYAASIQCASDDNIIFFRITGSQTEVKKQLLSSLENNFSIIH